MLLSLANYTTQSFQTLLVYICVCGVAVHAVFKHYEPSGFTALGFFLFLLPALLSSLLAARLSISVAVATAFAAYYASLCSSIVIYRLSPFHPYYRYPGPTMCKVSRLRLAWISSYGKQHLYIQHLHEKYGDVVRIGPNEISIRDASVINTMMGTQGLPKGPNWSGRTFYEPHTSLIAVRDPHEHFLRRKPWTRALNKGAIKELQPALAARVAQLVEGIGSRHGVLDLSRWLGFFTYDFMCDMAFGGGSEMMRDGDPEDLWGRMERALSATLWFDHLPWLGHYLKKFKTVVGPIANWRITAVKRIENRQRGGSLRKDLIYSLSNEDIGEDSAPSITFVNDGILAIIAGSDTTSSVLSNAFYYLLSNPDVYARLQSEVDRYYPGGEDALDPKYYPEMAYLEAVINETLRLMPAVLSGSQRAPLPGSGGKLIGKYYIPEGNQVRIHFYSVHRDSRNFTDPDRFWPDRWLIAEGAQSWDAKGREPFMHNADAFVPFSHGPTNCVGKSLAMHEMRTVLCHAVQKLTLRFAPAPQWDPRTWEREIEDRFVMKHGQLLVEVQARCRI